MSEHPDVAYLKKDEIGRAAWWLTHAGLVISKGLASLYETRPKNPVDFLGKWLLSYAKEQKLYKDEKAHKLLVKELRKKHEDHLDKEEQERKKEAKKQDKKEEEVQDFYKKLDRSDDFYDLLQEFTEFLQLNTSTPAPPPTSHLTADATGVYIAEMEQQKKEIDDAADENAHLNPEGAKLLRYRFVSKGH